jgi:hypothetical protein
MLANSSVELSSVSRCWLVSRLVSDRATTWLELSFLCWLVWLHELARARQIWLELSAGSARAGPSRLASRLALADGLPLAAFYCLLLPRQRPRPLPARNCTSTPSNAAEPAASAATTVESLAGLRPSANRLVSTRRYERSRRQSCRPAGGGDEDIVQRALRAPRWSGHGSIW